MALCLTWQGESDNLYSEVVGYQQGALKELFQSPSMSLLDLKRKDQSTLEGHVEDRDDIVGFPHDGFILTVSLKDFSTKVSPPDILPINFDTHTTDTLNAYQLLSTGEKAAHVISPDTDIHIDTFYSRQKLISFHLKDSTRLLVPHDAMVGKVHGNDAG